MLKCMQQRGFIPTFGDPEIDERIFYTSSPRPEKYCGVAIVSQPVSIPESPFEDTGCSSNLHSKYQPKLNCMQEKEFVPTFSEPEIEETIGTSASPKKHSAAIVSRSVAVPETPVDNGFLTNFYSEFQSLIGYISYDFVQLSTVIYVPIVSIFSGYEQVHATVEQGVQIAHPEQFRLPVQQLTHRESTGPLATETPFMMPGEAPTTEGQIRSTKLNPADKGSNKSGRKRTKLNSADKDPKFRKPYTKRATQRKPILIGEWQCVPCNRVFRSERGLLQHNYSFHSRKPYTCNVCSKPFRDRQGMLQHQQHHTALDKRFKCKLCTQQYHYNRDLKRHIELHHEGSPFVCRYCGKTYARNDHLIKHETHHENGTTRRRPRKQAALV